APHVAVDVEVPEGASADPDEMARRAVVPVESAIRSLGRVTSVIGQVSSNQAWLDVRLERGVDPEIEAARLLAQLGALRHELPQGSQLAAWPSGESRAEAL